MQRVATLFIAGLLIFAIQGCDSGPSSNTAPMADFTLTPDDPRAGNAVTFSADASDPDGSIESYEWSTSDGAEGSGSSFSHAFAERGSYSVTLEVTDDQGKTVSSSKTIEVRQRYSQVTIESVTLRDFPFTNDSGQGWDFSGAPDPYYIAYNATDETQEAVSGYFSNVGPNDLPLTYSETSFTINDLSKQYNLNLYDSDTSEPDFIGGVGYTFEKLVGEYPQTFTLEAGGITYDVELDWGN